MIYLVFRKRGAVQPRRTLGSGEHHEQNFKHNGNCVHRGCADLARAASFRTSGRWQIGQGDISRRHAIPKRRSSSTGQCCTNTPFGTARHEKVFEDVLKADPECGIAYWGIALSVLLNPHAAPPVKNLAEGAAAITKGQSVGAKTQRERDYIDALAVMYADYDKVDHRTRIVAYSKAMEQLAQRYPNDDEAQIHYALSLNTSASAADKTYANQLKGAAILEPIFVRQPQHPGVAHYLIHLYDYPPIAEKGLNAARMYAKIAPDAAHAQHMPSHIFTRVGYWQEFDQFQHRVAACRERIRRFRRATARYGLPRVCLPTARPGLEREGRY